MKLFASNSLRQRLLVRLSVPLAALLMVGAVLAYGLAFHFASVVHDRWLLDSAMTLATQLRSSTGRVTLDLPPSAVAMFEWDSVDRIYSEVISTSGQKLFGNATFPQPPQPTAAGEPVYYDALIEGNPVRVAAISVRSPTDSTQPIIIQVAETRKKREALMREILVSVVPLQIAIMLAAGALVWFAVASGLSSLGAIATRLEDYDPQRLKPLADVAQAPTEVRPLMAAVNALIRKLAESQSTQQRFVANAAHQLRTPLANLQVQTERALRERNPERQRQALSNVSDAVTRMRHLSRQLLTLSRSGSTAADSLLLCDVDLGELARRELERWADAAFERRIDLGYEGPKHGPIVRGEPQLLSALIGNLVDNAIRYGRAGGEVTLGVREEPLQLFVEDDGPGIPLAERTRVIDPFYRPPGSHGDGCGLGLAIAREIAARHRASLRIDAREPFGTRIEVAFAGA